MSSQFPDSLDSFTVKVDNVDVITADDINSLQDGVSRIESCISPLIREDDELLTLCHFEGRTSGYRDISADESGAVRYFPGKYGDSVFVEEGTTNYVENPAFRESDDLWTFVTNTGSMSCGQVTSDYPEDIDTSGSYQVNVEDDGNVDGTLKTTLAGLSADTTYPVSFWVKNEVSGSSFTGTSMRIVRSDGSGASGSSFSVTSDWERVSSLFTTESGQDSFVLEVRFEKTGAVIDDKILFCGFQVENSADMTTYCDGSQGTGYSWTGGVNSSSSLRDDTIIQYPVGSHLSADIGSVGFWVKPAWDNDDTATRIFFDTASSSSAKRMSVYKDGDNKLNFRIDEPGGDYSAVQSVSAVDWESEEFLHVACTYDFDDVSDTWDLTSFVNGHEISTSSSGTASTSSALPDYMYLGTNFEGGEPSNSYFDDFFAYSRILSDVEISRIYDSPIQMSEGRLRATIGTATTDGTPGVETAVAHGLGEIPGFVDITEKGAGLVYISSDATNEYFYVKSTASSIDFAWRAAI